MLHARAVTWMRSPQRYAAPYTDRCRAQGFEADGWQQPTGEVYLRIKHEKLTLACLFRVCALRSQWGYVCACPSPNPHPLYNLAKPPPQRLSGSYHSGPTASTLCEPSWFRSNQHTSGCAQSVLIGSGPARPQKCRCDWHRGLGPTSDGAGCWPN